MAKRKSITPEVQPTEAQVADLAARVDRWTPNPACRLNPNVVVVAVTMPSGHLNIVRVVQDDGLKVRDVSKEAIDALLDKDPETWDRASWRVVKESDLPTDREHRGGWRDRDGAIVVDMAAHRRFEREQAKRIADVAAQRAAAAAAAQALLDSPDPDLE